jgi:hypothetical protein
MRLNRFHGDFDTDPLASPVGPGAIPEWFPPLTPDEGPTVAAGVLAISPAQVIGTRFGRIRTPHRPLPT